jgi:hypothetical protein
MARPSNKSNLQRKEIAKAEFNANHLVTASEIKKKCQAVGINTTISTIEADLDELRRGESTSIFRELEASLDKLNREAAYNERMRDACKSESAAAVYSRLVKDIIVKASEIASTLATLRAERKERITKVYQVNIGTFPLATDPKKKKENPL